MFDDTLKLALLISLVSLIIACEAERGPNKDTGISSIVTIGDSIGNGFGLAKPWPELLKETLDVPIANHSVNGKETTWGAQMIASWLDADRPSHVLIMLGSNDAARQRSVDSSIANLQRMVDIAGARSIIVLVATVIPNHYSPTADLRAREISEGIKKQVNAVIVDVRAQMGKGQGLLADGIHPNDAGQLVIANAFLDTLANVAQADARR